jgi:drug/metabolite transporter (DMT)-like permease
MSLADLVVLAARMLCIAVIVMCFQAAMTAFQRRKAKIQNGWRYLTPGPIMWIALMGGLLLTGVFTLVSFSPSARDSTVLTAAIFFNLVTLTLAYSIFAEEVRWNDTRIERRTFFLQRRTITWHELAAVGVELSGYWWVSGYEGLRLRFTDYNHGFRELIAKIAENLPPEGPPPQVAEAMREVLVPVRAG